MAICVPTRPEFANTSELRVWETLRDTLPAGALLLAHQRVSDRSKDHEADLVVAIPGAGVAVLEVKGGTISHDGRQWTTQRRGRPVPVEPVRQAREARYALRDYVGRDPRWVGRRTLRWQHFVVLPFTTLSAGFELPDCPAWMIVGREGLGELSAHLVTVLREQQNDFQLPGTAEVALLEEVLAGRPLPMADALGQALEREDRVERLTAQQVVILDAIALLHRVEVRGGAGSGKTWLAVEQARRLTRAGQRVALTCYSRGLSAFLQRRCGALPATDRPAYVGTLHGLGLQWGAAPGSDDDSEYWEERLPAQMVELAAALPAAERFDAVVVDEAQDFADAWWTPLLASLQDEDGGVYVFSDEGQQVFSRYGGVPLPLVPIVLDTNLRNSRPIAESFRSLSTVRMRVSPFDGPPVRFVACAAGEALQVADEQVRRLLAQWRPQDVALLTTGSRHPEQTRRQAAGPTAYWDSFWHDEQVFYGHVLGFKGLERRAVVLAVNESGDADRARERLYVGLSRARDQLVVCGDPVHLRQIGGPEVAERLGL